MHFLFFLGSLIWHIELGGEKLQVEVVTSQEEKNKGLAGRTHLNDHQGMLFIYSREQPLVFWMKGMKMPICIAFFDAKKKLINVEEMDIPAKGQPLPLYKSETNAKYALELPSQWFQRHPVEKGESFVIVN